MCSVFTAPVDLVSRPDKDCDFSHHFLLLLLFFAFVLFSKNTASGWIFTFMVFLMPTAAILLSRLMQYNTEG